MNELQYYDTSNESIACKCILWGWKYSRIQLKDIQTEFGQNTSQKLQVQLPYVYILGEVGNSDKGTVRKRPALPTYFTKIESEKFI